MKSKNRSPGMILKYLLEREGMRVKDLAKVIGRSESLCSRIISGKTQIKSDYWADIAEYFDINYDALYTGVITTFDMDSSDFLAKTAPNKKDCFSSGKLVRQYIDFFKNLWTEEDFENICKQENVNPVRFVNIANPIDIEFNMRLVQYCRMQGKLMSLESTNEMAKNSVNLKIGHGDFFNTIRAQNGLDRLKVFLDNVESYEKNHEYKIEDYPENKQAMTVSFKPRQHINKYLYFEDIFLKGFFEDYIGLYFKNLSGEEAKVEKLSSLFEGQKKCILKVTLVS